MTASGSSGAHRASYSSESTSAFDSGASGAQLSASDRVPTDVSSVAMNRGRLGSAGAVSCSVSATLENSPATASDADVMLRVKTGDESAFTYLVEKYRRPMVGFMYRMCHNPSAAEELAQEVFLRVYRSRSSYEASAKFSTWLYRIAMNLAVNHARDTRHERPENVVRLDEPDQETGTTPDLPDESLSA